MDRREEDSGPPAATTDNEDAWEPGAKRREMGSGKGASNKGKKKKPQLKKDCAVKRHNGGQDRGDGKYIASLSISAVGWGDTDGPRIAAERAGTSETSAAKQVIPVSCQTAKEGSLDVKTEGRACCELPIVGVPDAHDAPLTAETASDITIRVPKRPPIMNSEIKAEAGPDCGALDLTMPPSEGGFSEMPQSRDRNGKIKKPLNAFMLWARHHRRKVAKAHPLASSTDVSVLLGLKWSKMSEEEKMPFYEEARKIKTQHRQEVPGNEQNLTYQPRPGKTNICFPGRTISTASSSSQDPSDSSVAYGSGSAYYSPFPTTSTSKCSTAENSFTEGHSKNFALWDSMNPQTSKSATVSFFHKDQTSTSRTKQPAQTEASHNRDMSRSLSFPQVAGRRAHEQVHRQANTQPFSRPAPQMCRDMSYFTLQPCSGGLQWPSLHKIDCYTYPSMPYPARIVSSAGLLFPPPLVMATPQFYPGGSFCYPYNVYGYPEYTKPEVNHLIQEHGESNGPSSNQGIPTSGFLPVVVSLNVNESVMGSDLNPSSSEDSLQVINISDDE